MGGNYIILPIFAIKLMLKCFINQKSTSMNIQITTNVRHWLLLMVCMFSSLPSWADDYTKDGIIYSINDENATAYVKGVENTSITNANIGSRVAGCDVTSIGYNAFRGCTSLASVTLPNSITNIGQYAFYQCSSLTSIEIPSSVTQIGSLAFYNCTSLTSVAIPSSVTSINEGLFWNCFSLTSVTIPNSVTSIGYAAFEGCTNLPSIEIPNSVTNVDEFAFENCHSLASVAIPSSVTNIGKCAFRSCTSLISINIPNAVTTIKEETFNGCSSLQTIYFEGETCPTIESNAFQNIASNPIVVVPQKLKDAYQTALSGLTDVSFTILEAGEARTKLDNLIASASEEVNADSLLYTRIDLARRTAYEEQMANAQHISESSNNDSELINAYDSLSTAYKQIHYALADMKDYSKMYFAPLSSLSAEVSKQITPDYSPLISTYTAGSNILTDKSQLSTNAQETTEGDISNLVDGNKDTYFHSTWSAANTDSSYAYLQIDLKSAYQNLLLDYTKRYNFTANNGFPTQIHVFGTNTPNEEDSWTDCGYTTTLQYTEDNNQSGKAIIKLGGNYQYVRLQVEATGGMQRTNGNLFFALSELGIRPITVLKEVIYAEKDGLITDVSQLSSNAIEPTEGSLEALIDNNLDTYFHSAWSTENTTEAHHFLQIDLKNAYKQIALKYSKRQVNIDEGSPVTLHIYVTNTPDDDESWTDLGTQTCAYDYDFGNTGLLPIDFYGTAYRYIRLMVEATTTNRTNNGNLFFYWSELHAYTRTYMTDALSEATRSALIAAQTQAKEELEAELATEVTYKALQSAYDAATSEVEESAKLIDFAKSSYLTAYSDHAQVLPAGVRAAIVIANGNSVCNDYRYNDGDVVPAETGILLQAGKGNSFYLTATEATETAPEDNLLHGTLNDETTNVEGANKYYKLSYDKATGTKIGFYWGTKNGGAFVNKAGKAFLALPSTMNAAQLAGFSLFDLNNNQAITGISSTEATNNADELKVYDLNGRRINVSTVDELPQGIYIINGKKIIK